jgi:hypothetical protein
VPKGVRRGLERARGLVERALGTADAARANRLLGKADGKLAKAAQGVDRAARRKRRPLSSGCAAALRAAIAESLDHLARLRQ